MDSSIIKNSSYYIYERSPTKNSPITHIPGGIYRDCKTVTFYTYDGNPIVTMEHNSQFSIMDNKLDPKARKPRPVSFKRIWWPGFDIGIKAAGYAVFFHDKNGNRIGWEKMESADSDVKELTEFDLSKAYEELADFSHKC